MALQLSAPHYFSSTYVSIKAHNIEKHRSEVVEDTWQPPEVMQKLVDLVQEDTAAWEELVDRFREAEELKKQGERIGKRFDLEPEHFHERKRPLVTEIAALFLERRFGKKYSLVSSQLMMEAHRRAAS